MQMLSPAMCHTAYVLIVVNPCIIVFHVISTYTEDHLYVNEYSLIKKKKYIFNNIAIFFSNIYQNNIQIGSGFPSNTPNFLLS